MAFTQADYAEVLADSGNIKEGVALMKQAINNIREYLKRLPKTDSVSEPPEFALMLATYGLMSHKLGDSESAQQAFNEAFNLVQKPGDVKTLLFAETLCKLAELCNELHRNGMELESIGKQLKDINDIIPYEHPITAKIKYTLVLIDHAYFPKKELEDVLSIQEACYGEIHPGNAACHELLMKVKKQINDVTAEEHGIKAADICKKLKEREESSWSFLWRWLI